MLLNKDLKFIFSVENFLPNDELLYLQELALNIDLQHLNRDDGSNIHYGFGAHFDPKGEEATILKSRIKNVFHPQDDLKILDMYPSFVASADTPGGKPLAEREDCLWLRRFRMPPSISSGA